MFDKKRKHPKDAISFYVYVDNNTKILVFRFTAIFDIPRKCEQCNISKNKQTPYFQTVHFRSFSKITARYVYITFARRPVHLDWRVACDDDYDVRYATETTAQRY